MYHAWHFTIRGQLSVSVDNDGAITGVRDTTQPIAELGTRPKHVVAAPNEPTAEPSLSGVRRTLDSAWERQMRETLLRGRLPIAFAEVPGTAEIGYVMRGDEATLVARRDVEVDCGSGLLKRYRIEAPIAG